MFEPVHRVMRGIWRKQTYAGKDEADDAEACRAVGKSDHSGDHGGRGAQRGLSHGLGLEKVPGIRCLDIELDSGRLRAFAERLRQREKQRNDRDQEGYFLVPIGYFRRVSPAISVLVLQAMLGLMLDRVHDVTHAALPSALLARDDGGTNAALQAN